MPGNSFTLPSFAKINLLLRVLGKRADGFHEICTVFQTVSLCDYLTFSPDEKINLTCDDKRIPVDEKNLIVRAAKILQGRCRVETGVKIHLEKRIPAPGGLGGGSSNAATALLGLIKLWQVKIDFEDLCGIGAQLGSDVPFFFYGGTGLGTGRGTEVISLENYTENHLLIVAPKVDVSTRDAFARINAPDLTNKGSKSILKICRDEVKSLYLRQSDLKNDFERLIFEIEPEIARVKRKLFDCGAKRALMSGSGASVFGIFSTNEMRGNALASLRQSEKEWRVFSAETVSRSAYQKSLILDKDF
jgi:4-diphosphocytidyl-2-C-methyl-D-erythritol kinase